MTEPHDPDTIAVLFERALSLPPEQREAFLEQSTDHASVRAEVASLLAAYHGAGAWFERAAHDVLEPTLGALVLDEPASMNAEELIDGYEIEARLGAGGMGVVYRARDTRLGRAVALKFLSPELSDNTDARLRLVREARAASALEHPNICTIYGIGETADGRSYIAMPCYDGETLRDVIARGPFPLKLAVDVVLQTARGLARAHEAGITHRDLKPGNVMLTSGGIVKVLDFGLARRATAEPLTESGTLLGTAAYMAPEQIRGERVDARADVWSLGVLLYEMLTGRRPFARETEAATLYAVLEDDAGSLRALRPEIPDALVSLVAGMLAKRPEDRLPDGRAVVARLEDIAAGDGGAAIATRRPPTKRVQRAIPLAAAAVALIALGLSVVPWPRGASEPLRRSAIAVLPFSVGGDASLDYLSDGMVHLLSTMLDGVPRLQVIDPHAVLGTVRGAAPPDPARGRALAAHFGAGRFVLGSVVRVGDRLQLSASLYDADGTVRTRAESRVAGEAALAAGLDSIARQLVAGQLDEAATALATVAAVTSHSFAALQQYLEGERLLRDGRPTAALDVLRRAVAADSTFALAWYRLARAAGWNGPVELNERAAEHALRFGGALPDRMRMLFAAYHAFRTGDPLDAERLYRSVLVDHPDDMETWELLGETLFHNNPHFGRSTVEARAPLERALALDPGSREIIVHLMDLAARERRLSELDSLTELYLRPDTTRETPAAVHAYRALRTIALAADDTAAVDGALAELAIAGPRALEDGLFRVAASLRDPLVADRVAALLTDPRLPASDRATGWLHRALFAVADGRWSDADRAWAAAAAIAPVWTLIHRVLALTTAPGSPADADTFERLRTEVADWRPGTGPLSDGQHAGELPAVRAFLLGLIDVRAALSARTAVAALDSIASRAAAGAVSTTDATRKTAVANAFARTLVAFEAVSEGRLDEALAALDAAQLRLPFHQRVRSPLLSQHLNRHLRARALRGLARDTDAEAWEQALRDGYFHWGVIYAPPIADPPHRP